MSKLFKRSWKVQVGTLDVSELSIAFEIKRDLAAKPNAARVVIRNLSQDSRQYISEGKNLPILVEAGYGDATGLIYSGTTRYVQSHKDGATIETEITSGDAAAAFVNSRINVSIPSSQSVDLVIKTIAQSMGVGPGNLDLVRARLIGKGAIHGQGTVLSGSAADEMDALTKSLGLEWSVQNGALQVLEKGQPASPVGFLLSAETGLVGSPTFDNKKTVTCTVLLNPELKPGVLVLVDCLGFKGPVRVDSVEYTGDTYAKDWYAKIAGRRL